MRSIRLRPLLSGGRIAALLAWTLWALSFSGGDAAPRQAFESLRLYIQPVRETKVFLNGEAITPRILRTDKTLGLIELRILKGTEGVRVRLEHRDFRPLETTLSVEAEKERLAKRKLPRLLQLRAGDSAFELMEYWPTGTWPKSVTFLDGHRVLVPLLEGKGIDVLNITDGSISLAAPAAADARVRGFVETLILPDRGEFWVSQMTRAAVHSFSISDLAHRKTVKLRASWSKVLTRDRERGVVYVANWASKNISVVDVTTMSEVRRIPAGGVPRGMVVSPDGRSLYIGQFTLVGESDGRGRVLKVDIQTGRSLKYLGPYGAKRHLVADRRGRLFVSDMAHQRVEVYDMNTDTEVKRIAVYHKPNTIVLSPDQRYLYVSCRGPNNPAGYTKPGLKMGRIYVIDTERLEVAEWWEGGNQPTGLDVSPDGMLLASSDFMDSRLRVYRRTKP